MKSLAAGTTKYLLLDTQEIERNAQRGRPGAPVVRVLEVLEDGTVARHSGYQILTTGPVSLDYNQRGHVVLDYFVNSTARQRIVRAAYYTAGEVLIAEDRDEVLAFPEPTTTEATKAKPTKSTKGN